MATYIKGVTDVLPGPTAMAPDYKLLGTALATLQNKYDKGFDQVKSMYSSMINRALSSSDNEKFRQDFLKKADAELSKLSGIDLSNPNNVTQANSIFRPLVNDKQYVKDLYLTESQDNEISKMEQTKTSSDSKVRETYDPKMERWLYLGKKRLTEMKRDDGSIDGASYNKFAPWEDPIAYGMKMAKEQGLEIGRTEFEGMFLRHVVGGEQAVGPYKNWFKTVIGDKFDNQFRIEAELDYEDRVSNLMAQDKNLDRQGATQKLAQDFSGTYVKLMNNEINDTQTRIEEIDSKIRAAKRSYPKGLPADKVKIFQNLAQQKIQLEDQVQKLNKEKGTDQEFQQKALELFVRNPAGSYVNQVKDKYATEFGIAKATTKTDETYEANQPALQEDRQKHEWGMMIKKAELDLARDKEMEKIKQDNAIELEAMKGTLLTQASGATYGNDTNAGSYTLDYAYTKSIQNNLNTAVSGYVDDKVLAVAANLNYTNAGISTGVNDGLNMAAVKQAIINRGSGQPLTADQTKALSAYLKKVKPGFNFDPNQHSFADIQTLINYGFGANQRNYANTNVARAGLTVLDRAGKAMNSYTAQFNDEQTNLQAMAQNQTLKPYITQSNGVYAINYAALNKLNEKDKNMYLDYLIPYAKDYRKSAAVQARTIELHPKDPTKMDPSIYRNIIENSLAIGVGNVPFTEEQAAKLREIARGDENLKNLFDTGVKYELVIVDNKEMFRVKVPVKRSLTGDKPKSMATQFGIDDDKGSIAASNYVDFLVDAASVNNIGGNDLVMVNPKTKQTQVYENDLKKLLSESINKIDVPRSKSWVTTNGFGDPDKGVSIFPPYLSSRIGGGQISRAGDEIIIDILKFDNTVQHINFTEDIGITYNQYKQNTPLYDKVLSDFIERISNDYAFSNLDAANVKHTVNTTRTDVVPWDIVLKP